MYRYINTPFPRGHAPQAPRAAPGPTATAMALTVPAVSPPRPCGRPHATQRRRWPSGCGRPPSPKASRTAHGHTPKEEAFTVQAAPPWPRRRPRGPRRWPYFPK